MTLKTHDNWETIYHYKRMAVDRPYAGAGFKLIDVKRCPGSNFSTWYFEKIERPIEDEYNHEWLLSTRRSKTNAE